ncbi:adenosylcobinamide-phosphate synthase CbiB [Roseibium aestuarii]|uniref:Cobalamin biosynthesis protein CobD n=1 Tax=Roseibium aestuarii TaxID=2600299 RepID=A0ABW4JS91_9HYPH|nr:adenosylcobinamide-phosphate synthase CbiB [Roseibium aestuarii]
MLFWQDTLLLLLAALALDALIGDPDWIWRRLPHPVVWIGGFIRVLERALNRKSHSHRWRRGAGVLTLLLLLVVSLAIGLGLQIAAEHLAYGEVLIVLPAAILVAQRSLHGHVAAVRDALSRDGLPAGRRAVSMIVGRDPEKLDEAGVSRAAIESAAENLSDGVVAPVFWFALLGLPGLIAYKAVNTADSMIGHKTAELHDFGWAAARFDDLINLPASRLTGLLIALVAPIVGGSPVAALKTVYRDARKHRSPNAGWPEAAMAGALGIALAGPRAYADYVVRDPFMNPKGRKEATAQDINRALIVLRWVYKAQFLLVLGVFLLTAPIVLF